MKHITVYGSKPEADHPHNVGILVDDEKADNDKWTSNFAHLPASWWAENADVFLWLGDTATMVERSRGFVDFDNALYSVPLPADWEPRL